MKSARTTTRLGDHRSKKLLSTNLTCINALEQIVEAYYSYAITDTTKVTFDYQFIANPAYNAERGPVNAFAGRLHTQF